MIQEVRVYTPEGVLKKRISSKTLIRKMWREAGIDPAGMRKGRPQGDFICEGCKKTFPIMASGQKYCTVKIDGEKGCYQKHLSEKIKAKEIERPCNLCKKPFSGTGQRRYCGDPCTYVMHRAELKRLARAKKKAEADNGKD